ncbi:glycosyltransferase family 4 protein [Streptococcus cameli]
MKHKVAIIGHFGGAETFTDGQTVKTLTLYNELKEVIDEEIQIIDTYYSKKNPLKLFFSSIKAIITSKNIILLISSNGMKVFFPLLYFGKKLFGTNVIHDIIGGRFGIHVDSNPSFVKYLNGFDVNLVETEMLQKDLELRGITNVEVMPNFRRKTAVSYSSLDKEYTEPFAFCTFSRVTKKKGIKEAILAVEALNYKSQTKKVLLEIYGPIDPDFNDEFEELLASSSDAIRYCGEVDTSRAVEILKSYYGVLFPTFWEGEGIAGTITESFFAGVPVIASDWNCNSEVIETGRTGLIYPGAEASDLISGIEWLINRSSQEMYQIKKNCVDASYNYIPDRHISRLLTMMK